MPALLASSAISPAKLIRCLEKDIRFLPVLWPMLTESVAFAGRMVAEGSAPLVWVNRVLDVALRFAPHIVKAAQCGAILRDDAKWPGLTVLAEAKSKSAAVEKAKRLCAVLLCGG